MPDQAAEQRTPDRAASNRLACPSCGAGFAIPSDPSQFWGKRARCQVCATPFWFVADGLSLTPPAEAAAPTAAPPPPGERAPARALGEPRRDESPRILLGADRSPPRLAASGRSVVPWAIAAVALVVLLPMVWLAGGASRKQGTIQLQLEAPGGELTLSIDDRPISPEQLRAPLTLPVGPHRLSASGKGLVAFQGLLPVFEGANPPFPVKLTALPKPTPEAVVPPVATAPRAATATATEPPAAQDTGVEDTGAEATVPPSPVAVAVATGSDMPAEAVPPASAVMGEMEGEKVEPDPAFVGEMEGGKVEPDAGFLGPDAKTGPKADATLRQVAADPASYLDASIVPADLLLIDAGAVGGPAGKRAGAPDLRLAIKSREGAYRDAVPPGTSFEIRLTSDSAAAIRDQVRSGNLVGGEYPALVQFKVTRDPANPQGFVGLVEWVELLVYVDPRHYFNGKSFYNKVFTVVRVTDGGAGVGLSRNYQGWRKRLTNSSSILSKLRNAYNQAFTLNHGVEYDQLAQLVRTKLPSSSRMLHDRLMSLLRGR